MDRARQIFDVIVMHHSIHRSIAGLVSQLGPIMKEVKYHTSRKICSYTRNVSALQQENRDYVNGPWDFTLPSMQYARHSAAIVALGEYVQHSTTDGRNTIREICRRNFPSDFRDLHWQLHAYNVVFGERILFATGECSRSGEGTYCNWVLFVCLCPSICLSVSRSQKPLI